MEREDDVQLIQRTLSGDDTAFGILLQRYQKSVHALVWRKIGDFHIAEDITQDTFLQAYKKLSTLKNPNQFAGWLYVIADRFCIDWSPKRRLRTQSLEGTPVEEIERASYIHHVSEARETERTERRYELVKKLLAKLPESVGRDTSPGKTSRADTQVSNVVSVSVAPENAAKQWSPRTDMPTARFHFGTCVVDRKVFAIGGGVDKFGDISIATVEMYNPKTDTWERKADMSTARAGVSTLVVEGKIYAIGGAETKKIQRGHGWVNSGRLLPTIELNPDNCLVPLDKKDQVCASGVAYLEGAAHGLKITYAAIKKDQWNYMAIIFKDSTIYLVSNDQIRRGKKSDIMNVVAGDLRLPEGFKNFCVGGYAEDLLIRKAYFHGEIDAIRFSNIARYDLPAEVGTSPFEPPHRFVADKHTLALWDFGEKAGADRFEDTSGNGYTLIGMNGATTSSALAVNPANISLTTTWGQVKSGSF